METILSRLTEDMLLDYDFTAVFLYQSDDLIAASSEKMTCMIPYMPQIPQLLTLP